MDGVDCVAVLGYGALGVAIVEELMLNREKRKASLEIRIVDILPKGEIRKRLAYGGLSESFESKTIKYFHGSICDEKFMEEVLRGVTSVFHNVSIISWAIHPPPEFYKVNVDATIMLLDLAEKMGCENFIYTSSFSVIYKGQTILNGDENIEYADDSNTTHYGLSKGQAERHVIKFGKDPANRLKTCALRPVGLLGPWDRTHFPLICGLAQIGIWIRLGTQGAKQQWVYSRNAAHMHLCADQTLKRDDKESTEPANANGEIFCCTDSPSSNVFDFYMSFLKDRLKFEHPLFDFPFINVHFYIMYPFAVVSDLLLRILRISWKPLVTKHTILVVSKVHEFSNAKAKKQLGYRNVFTREEFADNFTNWMTHSERSQTFMPLWYTPLLTWIFTFIVLVALPVSLCFFITQVLLK